MRKRLSISFFLFILSICSISLCACSTGANSEYKETNVTSSTDVMDYDATLLDASSSLDIQDDAEINWSNIEFNENEHLEYASKFSISYGNGYKLLTIEDEGQYLVVPNNKNVPKGLPEDITILQQPLSNVYLASSSAMDLIKSIDSISNIRLSGIKEDSWYIPEAVDAMKNGSMIFAGKYSAPDYELILANKCNLALENTMVHHTPEVEEKLIDLGIPVVIEHSSYEEHPFGRLEWIKFYGALFNKEAEAKKVYDEQVKLYEKVINKDNTGKTVAFFYINNNGAVNVRKPGDYISKMINLSGGNYIITALKDEDENALSTMNMQMEDFYSSAKDADVLIYNSTIDGEIATLDDFLEKSMLLSDFKAVKEGNVYCIGKNLYQETTGMGDFMVDLNTIFNEEDETNLKYIYRLR